MKPRERWWSAFPMFRALVAMVTGILFYDGRISTTKLMFIVAAIILVMPAAVYGLGFRKFRPGTQGLVFLVFACLGFLLMKVHDPPKNKVWSMEVASGSQAFMAAVIAEPSENLHQSRAVAELKAVFRDGQWRPVQGKLWMQFQGKMQEGDLVMFHKMPEPIPSPAPGPGTFYQYLRSQRIFLRVTLLEREWQLLENDRKSSLIRYGRSYLRTVMTTLFKDQQTLNMAGAILYGERKALPRDIASAYVQTGVIHVIAISGMHLALVYTLISILLKPFRRLRMRWLYTIACLLFLWIYAWICGGTPSVLRSAWMFSILLIGEDLGKEKHTANSLAASALVMLSADPWLLWDIGFQLSFAAVASLLVYQSPIQSLYTPENRLLANGWNLVATTLAAQVFTTPLVIYHFGQFSLVFLVSNMLAVPLSSLILILLFISCLVFPLQLAGPPAWLAAWLIRFMNNSIQSLGRLPFSSISHLHLTLPGLVNVYILLVAFTFWIRTKNR